MRGSPLSVVGVKKKEGAGDLKLLPFTFYRDQHAVRDHMHDTYTWRNKRVFNSRGSVEYTSLSRLYILHHFLLSFILSIFHYIIMSILESQDVVTCLNFISELRREYCYTPFIYVLIIS